MRNFSSYQLVSEHSILSARRKNGDAAGAPRTRSQRLKEFGERVRQIGATRESYHRCDANTTAPDFKVYDQGRGKTELANSRRWSHEEEIDHHWSSNRVASKQTRKQMEVRADGMEDRLDAAEKRIEGLEVKMAKVIELLDEITDNRKDCGSKKKNREGENEGGHGDEIGGDLDPPWKPTTIEAQREMELPEYSLLQAPDSGVTVAATSSLLDLGEISLSCVTVLCNREKKDEDEESSETTLFGESSPEEEDGGVTVKVMGTVGDGNVFHSFGNEKHDRFGKERKAGADWISQDLGPLTEPMGQAQSLIFTPPQFTKNRGVLQEKKEMGQKKEGIIFNSKAGGLDETMDPPNTLLTVEDKAIDPGGSFSVFGIARSSCFKLWDPGGRPLMTVFLISSP